MEINTMISILATIIRTTMSLFLAEAVSQLKWSWFTRDRPLKDLSDFDSCSRGPLGAVQLLVAPHLWYADVAVTLPIQN
jgi:hypothetical protein